MGIATATVSASNLPAQVTSDDPQGEIVFPRTTSLGAFFGATPVAQPSGNLQAALTKGQTGGIVSTYDSYQTAFVGGGVATITSSETGLTVMQGTTTNSRILIATGDMLYVNKPTAQAGLGLGNVRVSAANTVGVTLTNWTGATLTPTANQVYRVVSIRGLPTLSATLSPAAVAPNVTIEQQFAVTGVPSNALVQVSKPTSQAGLDIVGCRAVSNNRVGITFVNVTAATITPTASESYTIQALQPLDAHNDFVLYSLNFGAVGAIGVGGIITGGTTACRGVLATDIPIGAPLAPTAANNGLATTNSAFPIVSVLTADTLTPWFGGIGTGATPTANITYDQLVYRLAPTAPLVIYTQSLAPTSVAANTTAEQTFTVTGLVANSAVWVNKPSWTSGLGIAGVRVSSASTLAINFTNSTAAAIVPPTETYVIGNFQAVGVGATTSNTSGGAITQQAVPALAGAINQVNAVRGSLVSLGLWAGA